MSTAKRTPARTKAGKPSAKKAAKPADIARVVTKKAPVKATGKKAAGKESEIRILSAPKGYRTLTHKQIKDAIKSVFRERYGAHG